MKTKVVLMQTFSIVLCLAAFDLKRPTEEKAIAYPEGYRWWTHVKSGFIGPQHKYFEQTGGYHHIYANTIAMQGFKTGSFPEGSVIVFDVINFKEDNGSYPETTRKRIDVMVKESIYKNTGGWGYEEFKADSHTESMLNDSTRTQCYTCHAKMDDSVFSEFRN